MTSHSTRRRVVITGLGTVNPLALNVTDYWRGLLAGRSGIAPITRFDTANWQQTNGTTSAFKVTFGGEVKGFSPEPTLDTKAARHLDRFAQFAIVAAFEAVTDSGLDFAKENPFRCGCILGSGIGGIETIQDEVIRMHEGGPRRVSPLMVPKGLTNMASGSIAIRLGLRGPNKAVVTACSTANRPGGERGRVG